MALTAGTRLGPYEILAPIGAGGMGEVYKAHDTKLDRDVAIKVLPPDFAHDPERLARFEREAKVLASLNHPNIAQIYGIEDRALIMELVEGQTLQGPLPLETALDYAKQIADALEAAHDKGIIHRDLKPANIKVTPAGLVKVLDFGLAALPNRDREGADSANSPTLTISPTRAGMILGTAAYMSPEQARGKVVDKRADIWAFGVVLFEMLTGQRLFDGETVSDTLAAVLKEEPDWKQVPAKVRRLLEKCLEKDPKRRLRDIGDAWALLEGPSASTVPARSRLWPAIAALCLLIAIAGWLAFLYLRPKPHPAPIQRFAIAAPDRNVSLSALSPDGTAVVFSVVNGTGSQLWLRRLDSLEARPIEGSEGARGIPFWSPDSRFIVFGTPGKLRKIAVAGGPAGVLCDAGALVVGGFWTSDGRIVFSDPNRPPSLFEVSTTGGTASPLPGLGQDPILSPVLLPDGRHFVYVRQNLTPLGDIYLGSLDGNPALNSKKLLTGVGPVTVGFTALPGNPDLGFLLFLRGDSSRGSVPSASGTLMAQPFDLRKLDLAGEPIPIAEQVSAGSFSSSLTGILIYRTGTLETARQLTLLDRQGKIIGTAGEPGDYSSEMFFSPDSKRVIATRSDPQSGNENLWMFDLARGVGTRFTFNPGSDRFPVWSPDGSRIAFASSRGGQVQIYQKLSNGGSEDELLFKAENGVLPLSWSADGRFLLIGASPAADALTWVLPLDENFHVTGKPVIFVKKGLGIEERFSPGPNGRPLWVAYQSNDSGRFEVYVRAFDPNSATGVPPGSGVSQVSTAGGVSPRWSGNGKELFYMALDGRSGTVMSVDVSGNPAFQSGTPKTLFKPQGWISDRDDAAYWDVSSDGQKFLLAAQPAASAAAPAETFTVVLNWTALLKK